MTMNLIEELITATKAGKLTWVFDSETNTYHEHSLNMYVSTWVISVNGTDVYNAKSQRDLHDLYMAIENSIRASNMREDAFQWLMAQLATR